MYKAKSVNVFREYYEDLLPKKAHSQLMRAIAKPKDQFWQNVILPNVLVGPDGQSFDWKRSSALASRKFICDLTAKNLPPDLAERPGYIGLSGSKYVEGRSQFPTLSALDRLDWKTRSWIDPRDRLSFFTNHLKFGVPGDETWNSPSLRSVFGPATVLTIEIDPPSSWSQVERIDLLASQMAWLRRSGNSRTSAPIFRTIDWASRFADFRGVTVCYSGNKSLHFHFVFDTNHVLAVGSELHRSARVTHETAWARVAEAFLERLNPTVDVDQGLRFPEQYRRLPNGTSYVCNRKPHLFGVPTRAEIPQVTLFEQFITRAPKGADRWLFDPVEMQRAAVRLPRSHTSPARPTRSLGPWACEAERVFCEDWLRSVTDKYAGNDGYPKLAELVFDKELKAKFFANEYDQTPNTIMFERANRTMVVGGRTPKSHITLPLPLFYHVDKYRREWRKQNPGLRTPKDMPDRCVSTPVNVLVRSESLSISDAAPAFESDLRTHLAENKTVLAVGPEGLGKTTAAMALIPELARQIRDRAVVGHDEHAKDYRAKLARSLRSAVATASYDQAEAKCVQFNRAHRARAIGVLFKSFHQVYHEALEDVHGDDACKKSVNSSFAAKLGYRSVIAAIRSRQPDVWQRMGEIHEDMMAPAAHAGPDKLVVLFMVHDVLHQWAEGGLSRLFSHPDFFDTEPDQYWTLQEFTELAVVVHDELDPMHFVHLEPLKKVRWCEELFRTGGAWDEQFPDLVEAKSSWEAYSDNQPASVSFEDTLAVFRSHIASASDVGVGPVEAYGVFPDSGLSWDMYAQRHTKRYAYRKRNWWNTVGRKVIMLTTEALPTEMFRSATIGQSATVILDATSASSAASGRIEVHVLSDLKTSSNHRVAAALRDTLDLPDLHVIANGGDDLDDRVSHVKAKGANDFDDVDILQISNFLAPGERDEVGQYDLLQMINQLYGLKHAIRLWHVDQINQAAGRNLGYRYRGRRHLLAIPAILWEILEGSLVDGLRYKIEMISHARTRRDRKHSEERAHLARLSAEEQEHEWHLAQQDRNSDLSWLDSKIDQECERNLEAEDQDL